MSEDKKIITDGLENEDGNNTIPSSATSKINTDISNALAEDLTLSSNQDNITMENWFHSPVQHEVHQHLDWNVGRIFLDQLRQKDIYTKFSICVDWREDGEGIASFGGFAGIIGSALPALKELFPDADAHAIIKWWLADTKFYVHCDDHTQHDTHGAAYCDCKKIGCGAINLMLKPENGEAYGYENSDRDFFWNLIDSNAAVKVLQWEHEEQWIISIENRVRNDKDSGAAYINHTKANVKDGVQYFVNHVTGRNIIIDYFAEDLANYIIQNHSDIRNGQKELDDETLVYTLKDTIMQRSDKHAGATLWLLWAAQKVFKEKWDNAVIPVKKLSKKGKQLFTVE